MFFLEFMFFLEKTVLFTRQASSTRIRLFRAWVRVVVRVMNSFGVMVRVRVVVSVVDSFGVIVRVRVGIRVYVKPFCLAVKP